MIKKISQVNRKTVNEDRIAICPHFGCSYLKKVKPLKLGILGFRKYPKCPNHKIYLAFVDEFIGNFLDAVIACLFDRASLPPEQLIKIINLRIPNDLKSFINGWMYCNPIGRGAQILSHYMDGLSRGYIKLLSRKQKKKLQSDNRLKKKRYQMLRKGLEVIAKKYKAFLQELHDKPKILHDPQELHPLSEETQIILKNWLKNHLYKIQDINREENSNSEESLTMLKEKYDKILHAGTCACLLGKSPEIVTKAIPAFELFSAYNEFIEAGLCEELTREEIKDFLEKIQEFLSINMKVTLNIEEYKENFKDLDKLMDNLDEFEEDNDKIKKKEFNKIKHPLPTAKSLVDQQKDIENIVIEKNGRIIEGEWRFLGKNKRKTPFFHIICNRDCGVNCGERREFWCNKYELKPNKRHPEGKWCPYKILNKSLKIHQMEIIQTVKKKGGKILDSKWRYIGSNNDKRSYFLIECNGNNKFNEKHQWWVEKNKLKGSKSNPEGSWCPKCPRKTLKEYEKDIQDIVIEKKGKILDSKWRYDEKNRKYPYFLIECGGNNERNEKHQWWINKTDLVPNKNHPKGVWCRECQNKTLDEHQRDIIDYVKKGGGRILGSEWRYITSGKYKSKTPFFYLECDNKRERHRWWVSKGNLLPKPSNPTGGWCKVCTDRIRAISDYAHIIIEYYSLFYLNLKNCRGKHEDTLDEGTRPDLTFKRDHNFKSIIEAYQRVILFSNDIEEITVDFTMSLIPSIILSKCFRSYQNESRYLLIVLMREEGFVTTQNIQELIIDNEDLDNDEKSLIKVLNFDEYLQFLNLEKKGDSLSKREEKIMSTLKKTIKLSIEAIKSRSALEKLTSLSEKCYKLLYY